MLGNFLKRCRHAERADPSDIRAPWNWVNALESSISALRRPPLPRDREIRQRVANCEPLDDLLPRRSPSYGSGKRVLAMRHFDVQLMAASSSRGPDRRRCAPARGRRVVATLPIVLNALTGGASTRDGERLPRHGATAEWMGKLYRALGMSVASSSTDGRHGSARRPIVATSPTGTEQRVRLDYPPGQHEVPVEDMVQRDLHYGDRGRVDRS